MSNWPGKFVIGLTGNISTGKSVVRRMLEHLGAYTIDADALTHRAYAKGAPGYQPVIDKFGKWLVSKDGEVDRVKLGTLVFHDREAMSQLEAIVHPLVRQATELLVQRSTQRVVVIEAIKLLESDLRMMCDSIWVANASEDVQVERLMRKRGLARDAALERVRMQAPQKAKVNLANIVLTNSGSYDDLWKQVTAAWKDVVPAAAVEAEEQQSAETAVTLRSARKQPRGEFVVLRGKPRNSATIAEFITRMSNGARRVSAENVMADFGDKAYMMLELDGRIVGLAGWQVENLVARTTDVYLEPGLDAQKALQSLVTEVEHASADLQCEASLLFPMKVLADETMWKKLGYERHTPETLGVQAWQDAAKESMSAGSILFFKQLRTDRILRPI